MAVLEAISQSLLFLFNNKYSTPKNKCIHLHCYMVYFEIFSLSPLSLATDVTDATLGASGLWLGTRTGAGGTATLTESFLAAVHGSMDSRILN